MASPPEVIFDLTFGRWRSQILYTGVTLGVFDALADGPANADTLASTLGLDALLLYRLLRALGSLGALAEDNQRSFALTPVGDLLKRDHPQTLRGMVLLEEGPVHYALWKHLPAMVRDGKQNAFVREFGHMAFDHAHEDPEYTAVFNEAMSSYSAGQSALALEALEGVDFRSISHLCDVGGGHGHLLCSFLAKYPHLRGTVMDLPSVVGQSDLLWAERLGVADRCEFLGGDMFEEVPAADAYLTKMIIHDWNDDECVRILSNMRKAASPNGRVFVIEHVVPGPATPHFAKLFDVHMMCWGTGRERTVDEHSVLLKQAGWSSVRTWQPQTPPISVVEGF
jgi:hypothetical protein